MSPNRVRPCWFVRVVYWIGMTVVFGLGLYYSWSRRYRRLRQPGWEGHVEKRLTVRAVLDRIRERKWRQDGLSELGDAIGFPRFFDEASDEERSSLGQDCDEYGIFSLDAGRDGLELKGETFRPVGFLSVIGCQGWRRFWKQKGHNVAVFQGEPRFGGEVQGEYYHLGNWGFLGPFDQVDDLCEMIARRMDSHLMGYSLVDGDLDLLEWRFLA